MFKDEVPDAMLAMIARPHQADGDDSDASGEASADSGGTAGASASSIKRARLEFDTDPITSEIDDRIDSLYEDDALKPWYRLNKEPLRWFRRFQYYVHLGPSRTIADTVRYFSSEESAGRAAILADNVNPEWYKYVRLWQWRKRAEAYDEYTLYIDSILFEVHRRESKKQRILGLTKLLDRGVMALDAYGQLPPAVQAGGRGLLGITSAIKAATEGLRDEYDDTPTSRSAQIGKRGNTVIDDTDNEQDTVIEVVMDLGRTLPDGEAIEGEATLLAPP